jgi:hypothetical protein
MDADHSTFSGWNLFLIVLFGSSTYKVEAAVSTASTMDSVLTKLYYILE